MATIQVINGTDWGCEYTDGDAARWEDRLTRALEAQFPAANIEVSHGDVSDTVIRAADPETEATVREVYDAQWEEFCETNFDAPEAC